MASTVNFNLICDLCGITPPPIEDACDYSVQDGNEQQLYLVNVCELESMIPSAYSSDMVGEFTMKSGKYFLPVKAIADSVLATATPNTIKGFITQTVTFRVTLLPKSTDGRAPFNYEVARNFNNAIKNPNNRYALIATQNTDSTLRILYGIDWKTQKGLQIADGTTMTTGQSKDGTDASFTIVLTGTTNSHPLVLHPSCVIPIEP